MKQKLTKTTNKLFHYKNEQKIDGQNPNMVGDCSELMGNCSELRGDCSGLRGSCSGLRGDCSELRGDCSGLRGDCSGLMGNLDDCEITTEERIKKIDIKELITKENIGEKRK